MGFEDIWIDALCIVKDDEEDRQKEVDMMVTVYARSGLSFAATADSDGSLSESPTRYDV